MVIAKEDQVSKELLNKFHLKMTEDYIHWFSFHVKSCLESSYANLSCFVVNPVELTSVPQLPVSPIMRLYEFFFCPARWVILQVRYYCSFIISFNCCIFVFFITILRARLKHYDYNWPAASTIHSFMHSFIQIWACIHLFYGIGSSIDQRSDSGQSQSLSCPRCVARKLT